jgi:uncharacterized membrane protein YfcA
MSKNNLQIVGGVVVFTCSLIAFFLSLYYHDKYNLFIFWMIMAGSSLGSIIGTATKLKVSKKMRLTIVLIALCSIAVSIIMYFTLPNPIVYIVILNVLAMAYTIAKIIQHTKTN